MIGWWGKKETILYYLFLQPTSHSVALKYGLDISELTSGTGTEIEIDTKALESQESVLGVNETGTQAEDEHYERSEVYKQVSLDPILGTRDDSSESESDDGLVLVSVEALYNLGCSSNLRLYIHSAVGLVFFSHIVYKMDRCKLVPRPLSAFFDLQEINETGDENSLVHLVYGWVFLYADTI